jgi:hypothetical protein
VSRAANGAAQKKRRLPGGAAAAGENGEQEKETLVPEAPSTKRLFERLGAWVDPDASVEEVRAMQGEDVGVASGAKEVEVNEMDDADVEGLEDYCEFGYVLPGRGAACAEIRS